MKEDKFYYDDEKGLPLNPRQEKQIEEFFIEAGWEYSINEDGEKIWSKEI